MLTVAETKDKARRWSRSSEGHFETVEDMLAGMIALRTLDSGDNIAGATYRQIALWLLRCLICASGTASVALVGASGAPIVIDRIQAASRGGAVLQCVLLGDAGGGALDRAL